MPVIERAIEKAQTEYSEVQKIAKFENQDSVEFNAMLGHLKEIRLKDPADKPYLRAKCQLDYYKTSIVTKKRHLVNLIKELRSLDPSFSVSRLDVKDGEFDKLMDLF